MTEVADPWSTAVRALFANPRHAGRLADGTEVRIDGQGMRVILSATCETGTLARLNFLARGCPHFIAACEAFCASSEGRRAAALSDFSAVEMMQALGIPVEKTGRLLILEDAARALGKALIDGN